MSSTDWFFAGFSVLLAGLLPWVYLRGYRAGRRAQVETAERLGTRPRAFIIKREEFDFMKSELERMGFKMMDLMEPLHTLIKTFEARDKAREKPPST